MGQVKIVVVNRNGTSDEQPSPRPLYLVGKQHAVTYKGKLWPVKPPGIIDRRSSHPLPDDVSHRRATQTETKQFLSAGAQREYGTASAPSPSTLMNGAPTSPKQIPEALNSSRTSEDADLHLSHSAQGDGEGAQPTADELKADDEKKLEIIQAEPTAKILVEAGPGTGKTYISAMRLAHLIRNGLTPSQILVLSFSRSAVRTLANRLDRIAKDPALIEDLRHLSIRTFDSWTFRILRLAGESPSTLLNRTHDENVAALVRLMTGAKRKEIRQLIGDRRHIMIDEFQDLPGIRGRLVIELLSMFCDSENGAGFTVLGDRAQAIYDYAAGNDGAGTVDFWRLLEHRFTSRLKRIELDLNRRSTRSIAGLAKKARTVLKSNLSPTDKLAAVRSLIGSLPQAQAALESSWLNAIPEGSAAILARTNGEALRVAQKLLGSEVQGPSVPIRVQIRGHNPAPPAWIAALLGPLRSASLGRSAFEKIYAFRVGSLSNDVAHAISLPPPATAWQRLARAVGGPDDATAIDLNVLRERLRWSDSFPDDAVNEDAAIFISTIHQSKGKEFSAVSILDEPPLARQRREAASPEDEANVAFVAISRAGKMLARLPSTSIYDPPTSMKFPNGRERYRSWWNNWINLEMGLDGDIEIRSFVDRGLHGSDEKVEKVQSLLLSGAASLRGHKVMLERYEAAPRKSAYRIHLQEGRGAGLLLGSTGSQLTRDLLHLLWNKGYSIPARIMNLRIRDVTSYAGTEEDCAYIPDIYRTSRLWLGVQLFGTGDFKPRKRQP